jgi:hypothetical protein
MSPLNMLCSEDGPKTQISILVQIFCVKPSVFCRKLFDCFVHANMLHKSLVNIMLVQYWFVVTGACCGWCVIG